MVPLQMMPGGLGGPELIILLLIFFLLVGLPLLLVILLGVFLLRRLRGDDEEAEAAPSAAELEALWERVEELEAEVEGGTGERAEGNEEETTERDGPA